MNPSIEYVKYHTGYSILRSKASEELPPNSIQQFIGTLSSTDQLNVIHKCEISISNVNLAMVNTLRRMMLSYIPVASASKIKIIVNNTSLINEFIEQRISLLPLSMQDNKSVESYNILTDKLLNITKIKSIYDKTLGIRRYEFVDPDSLPKLSIRVEGPGRITSESIHSVFEYFKRDIFSNDYHIITEMKENDKLDIEIELECGIGYDNTIFSPVGTASMKPIYINKIGTIDALLREVKGTDDDSVNLRTRLLNEKQQYREAYMSYVKSITEERKSKGLIKDPSNPFDDEEMRSIEHDFDTLIRPRIYPNSADNKCRSFVFNIETNGNLRAEQIFIDSLGVLYTSIIDLRSNIRSERLIAYKENECAKISISLDENKYDVLIDNENHTLGNLLINYLNIVNRENEKTDLPVADFISYSQPHPLKNQILFRFIIEQRGEEGKSEILKMFNQAFDMIVDEVNIIATEYLSKINYQGVANRYPKGISDFMNFCSFDVVF